MTRRGPALRAALVLSVVVFTLVSIAFARTGEVQSEPTPAVVDRVVLFAVPMLGIDDIGPDTMPSLDRLARSGAIAATNVRTRGSDPDILDAYATLSAGNRVSVGTRSPVLPNPPEPGEPGPSSSTTAPEETSPPDPGSSDLAIEATARTIPGELIGGGPDDPDPIAVDQMAEIIGRSDAGSDPEAQPGALATSLRRDGLASAVVTHGGAMGPPGGAVPAPAAVAAADRWGWVPAGSVGGDLLRPDPNLPLGVTADGEAVTDAVLEALDRAALVVVDPGETTRLATHLAAREDPVEVPVEPTEEVDREELRLQALGRTDAILGQIEAELDRRTLLVVVGLTPPDARWALTPMVISGGGTPAGYLHSSSTHRPDLVTLTDVAPTILDALGSEPPAAMIGNPLAYRPGEASWSGALALDELLERRAPIDRPMAVGFIVVQTVVYLAAIGALLYRGELPRWSHRLLLGAVVTCAAWPLATFWLRIAPSLYGHGSGTFVLCWLVAAAVALGVTRLRRHPLDPVLALCGLTIVTLVGDLATGAHLQYGSFFGYAPTTAPRFTGIGNAAFALLGGATVVVCSAIVARSRDRNLALWVAGTVATIVVIADGAPWMGADVGGTLTLAPVLCVMMWALSGRRVRWHTLALAAVAGAVVLALAVGFESLRDPGQRTHIGRFFLRSGDGVMVQDTLTRKWSTNMEVLRRSPLAWLVPIIAGAGFVAVASGRAWRRVLPIGSPERIGVTATLALGFVGWILNDSGVVVLALASVFLGPYIVLLAQAANGHRGRAGDAGSSPAPPRRPTSVEDPMVSPNESPRPLGPDATVVAIVPAFNRADSVAATVRALAEIDAVDRVLVVDDGSVDDTARVAREAGATVLRLPRNRGKGAAVVAGAEAAPDADVFLLIDADLADTAAAADTLLAPLRAGEADLVIGALPPAEGRGGFGTVKKLAAWGIERAGGVTTDAPLSGQRAIRADLLRGLTSCDRFGLEVAMTIDVARAGGRIVEVPVPMDHRHTGRSLAGFAHRGRQGRDIVAALAPRLTGPRQRMGLLAVALVLISSFALVSGSRQPPTTTPLAARPSKVLVFGFQPFDFDDLERSVTPNLQRLIDEGSLGAMSIRSVGRTPSATEGYLTLGAGARLRSSTLADIVLPRDEAVGEGTAADYVRWLTGTEPRGDLVALGGPGLFRRNDNREAANTPGALGDVLAAADMTGAVVGISDQPATFLSTGTESRPAALAVMDGGFGVPRGEIDPEVLLTADAEAPFGRRADADAVVEAALDQLTGSEVVVVDPGDLSRAATFGSGALDTAADQQWEAALVRTDEILGRVLDEIDEDTLVLVVSVRPREGAFRLTPFVAWGPGVPTGTITSPSTQRSGLSAITDVAPTVIAALGLEVPIEFPGNPVRFEPGPVDMDRLTTYDADTIVREATYGPQSDWFINGHIVVYAIALLLMIQSDRFRSIVPVLRFAMLALASYPVASFLVRLVPGLTTWFLEAQVLVTIALALVVAALAARARSHAAAPLAWILALTLAVFLFDTWTGTAMHSSSWLGYSFHSAGRFYGVPNTTFAVLGSASLLWAGLHLDRSPRRRESLWFVGSVLFLVLMSAGLPMLGADVGTLITLFPIYALVLWHWSGRTIRIRSLVLAGAAMVVLVGAAAAVDLARPVDARSHLGQFADRFLDEGPAALWDTFARKQSANFRILGGSGWTRLAQWVGVYLVVVLVLLRRADDLLPRRSDTRVAVVAVGAAAVLGFLSNDSGPVVLALFMCFLPPLLTLRALAPPDEPQMLGPIGAGDATEPVVGLERSGDLG